MKLHAATPPRLPAAGIAFGGLLSLAAAIGIGRFVYTPILPFMVEDLGIGPADAGIVASSNYLGYLLGALAASLPVFGPGRRAWFFAALAASAVSTAAMGLVESFGLFLAWRFVGGVASAFVLVFASTLVLERLTASRRQGLFAMHFAGVGAGIALSAILVAAFAGFDHAWRWQWISGGVVSLLALIAAVFLIPRETRQANPEHAASALPGGRAQPMAALIAAYGLFGFGYVITATFISTMVRMTPELRPIEAAVWLVVGLAGAPSVMLWTWLGRRVGYGRSFAVACLVEAAGVAATAAFDNAVAVLLGGALLGGTFIGITAVGLVLARDIGRGDPRRSIGLMTAAFGLGQMIGPAFAGFAYGIGDSFAVPSLVAAVALVAAAALVPRGKASGSPPRVG